MTGTSNFDLAQLHNSQSFTTNETVLREYSNQLDNSDLSGACSSFEKIVNLLDEFMRGFTVLVNILFEGVNNYRNSMQADEASEVRSLNTISSSKRNRTELVPLVQVNKPSRQPRASPRQWASVARRQLHSTVRNDQADQDECADDTVGNLASGVNETTQFNLEDSVCIYGEDSIDFEYYSIQTINNKQSDQMMLALPSKYLSFTAPLLINISSSSSFACHSPKGYQFSSLQEDPSQSDDLLSLACNSTRQRSYPSSVNSDLTPIKQSQLKKRSTKTRKRRSRGNLSDTDDTGNEQDFVANSLYSIVSVRNEAKKRDATEQIEITFKDLNINNQESQLGKKTWNSDDELKIYSAEGVCDVDNKMTEVIGECLDEQCNNVETLCDDHLTTKNNCLTSTSILSQSRNESGTLWNDFETPCNDHLTTKNNSLASTTILSSSRNESGTQWNDFETPCNDHLTTKNNSLASTTIFSQSRNESGTNTVFCKAEEFDKIDSGFIDRATVSAEDDESPYTTTSAIEISNFDGMVECDGNNERTINAIDWLNFKEQSLKSILFEDTLLSAESSPLKPKQNCYVLNSSQGKDPTVDNWFKDGINDKFNIVPQLFAVKLLRFVLDGNALNCLSSTVTSSGGDSHRHKWSNRTKNNQMVMENRIKFAYTSISSCSNAKYSFSQLHRTVNRIKSKGISTAGLFTALMFALDQLHKENRSIRYRFDYHNDDLQIILYVLVNLL